MACSKDGKLFQLKSKESHNKCSVTPNMWAWEELSVLGRLTVKFISWLGKFCCAWLVQRGWFLYIYWKKWHFHANTCLHH